ncbi:MAG: hypothetical protein ACI8TF_001419 [Paracoccaceae bacterium]|jgi:hypothetical protein
MSGKILAVMIVLFTALFAGALWYFQTRAFYVPVEAQTPAAEIRLTTFDGIEEPLLLSGFDGINADTSPLRFRACFDTPLSQALLTETFMPYEDATPFRAPGWFSCFNAEALGAQLEQGTALAFLGQRNISYGIDRIVAVTDTGQGYVWHQINACGEASFDGDPLPADCPPAPERQ